MTSIEVEVLAIVVGGAQLNPDTPHQLKHDLLKACGSQIDAYTAARKVSVADPTNTRKEINSITAGRSLAVCAGSVGFDPPPAWRSFGPGK